MKRKFLYSFVFLLMTFATMVKAQAQPAAATVYQQWTKLGESTTMMDVSGQVIRCHPDSSAQLHLNVFNENSIDQLAHFTIRFTNPVTLEEVTKEVSRNTEKFKMLIASCDDNNYPDLRINIPVGWDPATVKITLTFIQ